MRIIGTSIVFVLALIGAGFLMMVFHGSQLESEAPQFLNEAIPAIASNWDPHELAKRASPEFLKVTPEEQLRDLFKSFDVLGAFIHYDGASGSAGWSYVNGTSTVKGSYVAAATFANGEATFTVKLSKRDDQWMIDFFQVDYRYRKKKDPQGT